MCKVTINGHTWLGSNEDSWRLGSRIWFEGRRLGKYGSLYVGYGDGFPQGGMNEAGLAFDGLTIIRKSVANDPAKKTIADPTAFMKSIMQNCSTVEEVKAYASQFNRTPFNSGVLLFSDRAGKYLVMEPDTLIIGNDSKYVIANFCPSTVTEAEKLNFGRYQRGEQYLQNHSNDTSAQFCYALTDTMHECRKKVGDGTMYSFVADLNKGEFHLYFYHDFKISRDFNLTEELAKGDHEYVMTTIFPPNAEYARFMDFSTPQNSPKLIRALVGIGTALFFFGIYFLISFFRTAAGSGSRFTWLPVSLQSLLLCYYCYVLIRNQAIFFFPSPYRDYKFSVLDFAAYIPFLLLLVIVPLLWQNIKIVKDAGWGKFSKSIFTLNSLTYLILIGLFSYWKLYNVF